MRRWIQILGWCALIQLAQSSSLLAVLDLKILSQTVSVNEANNAKYVITFTFSGGEPVNLALHDMLPIGTQLAVDAQTTPCTPGCTGNIYGFPNAVVCSLPGGSYTITLQGTLPPFTRPQGRIVGNQAAVLEDYPPPYDEEREANLANNVGIAQARLTNLLGDVDADNGETVNPADITYLINHLFAGGPPPRGPANVNGTDCLISVSDVLYLINYLNAGGPAPQQACCRCPGQTCSGLASPPAQSGVDTLVAGQVVTELGDGLVRVPVFLYDNPATLLGRDKPVGQRASRIAFRATFGNTGCVDPVTFDSSAGALASSAFVHLAAPSEPKRSQGVVIAVPESAGGIVSVSAAPTKLGDLVLRLDGCVPGLVPVEFTTDGPVAATVGSESGLEESTLNGGLAVENGSISIRSKP